MSRSKLLGIVVGLFGLCGLPAVAADRVEAVDYVEGFESDDNPVQQWSSKGEYRVNFAGLTDERSHNGRKSFKLDLTIVRNGDYNYWCGPILDVPAVEGMAMDGYIYIEEAPPNVSVGLGTSFYMPAVAHATGGNGRGISHVISDFSRSRAGEWIHQQADVPLIGQSLSRKLLGGEEAPGIYLEKWALQIFCRAAEPGSRIVVYIDDISIKGDVPADWRQRTEHQLIDWRVAYNSRQQEDLSLYRDTMARIHREAKALADQLPQPQQVEARVTGPWRSYALALLASAREQADQTVRDTANADKAPANSLEAVHDLWDKRIRPLQQVNATLGALVQTRESCLVFVQPNPITNYFILPTQPLVDGELKDTLSLFASPGEYEPASFVLLANTDATATLEIDALRSAEGAEIPAEALDLRVVKAWYQAGVGVGETTGNILVAELLLHDDALVEVDLVNQRNVVRDIDAPRDAADLQPVRLAPGQPRQFWLTVRVAEGTPAGVYTGQVRVSLEGLPPRTLDVAMEVLPLTLAEPGKDYGLYYRGQLNDDAGVPISSDHKTPAQLEADFRNMLAHGVTQPDVYETASLGADELDAGNLTRYLDIKERSGLPLNPLMFVGVGAAGVRDDAELAERIKLYRQVMAYASSRGIEDVYFMGADEAMGEALKAQRRVWEAIHKENGKVWVACSSGFFDVVGDLLDLPVVSRNAPKDIPRVHELGRKIYVYSVPLGGGTIEKPFSQRFRWGFWLDRSGFDGIHNYCYQHAEGVGTTMGRAWDDFDSTIYRAINYTYPTVDGPVDTLQWEAVREGIDDMRYLATLRGLMTEAQASGKPAAVEQAKQSERWLAQADFGRDLQALRREIADRAVRLATLLGGME